MTYDDGTYLLDREGTIWIVVRDGGMVTRAEYAGAVSGGISWLEQAKGPLIVIDTEALLHKNP